MSRIFSARKGCNLDPALSEVKIKIPSRARPDQFFFSDFGPQHLGDFKTGPFSSLHIIKDFFADDIFFYNLLKQPI